MTANEIIKAFECCLNDGTCENCPYKSKGVVCGSHMRNDVLALLIRANQADKLGAADVIDNAHIQKSVRDRSVR